MEDKKISQDMWERVEMSTLDKEVISRPSLTYWQDAWRRLKKNYLSMIGLFFIIIMGLLAIIGPFFSNFSYSDQSLHQNSDGQCRPLVCNRLFVQLSKKDVHH